MLDPHLAEEVAQAVFIVLARKADSLSAKTILAGWLCQTARYVSANALTGQRRRRQREQEAAMQPISNEPDTEAWQHIVPLLDEALGRLGQKDHDAIVLRYFEGKDLKAVGAALGIGEDSARMRVNRALEKLRKIFTKRGVLLPAAAIAGTISANSVQAAPLALGKFITAAAVGKGATAGGPTLTLVKGALKLMAWTKAKSVVAVAVIALLAGGTVTFTVSHIQKQSAYPWQVTDANLMHGVLEKAPPMVELVAVKRWDNELGTDNIGDPFKDAQAKVIGIGESAQEVIARAYGLTSAYRVVAHTGLSGQPFNYIASLPSGSLPALRQLLQKQWGVFCRKEIRPMPVLSLRSKRADAPGLRAETQPWMGGDFALPSGGPDRMSWQHAKISDLAGWAEDNLHIPVVDDTGLAGHFDISVKWETAPGRPWYPPPDVLKRIVDEQLGLELVPATEPLEVVVVEKAN